MNINRREALGLGAASAASLLAVGGARAVERVAGKRVAISTWSHGMAANEAAMEVLGRGGSSLDAVEAGVRVSESDPACGSVGLGGLPNAAGVVQLDAAIMDGPSARGGSVAGLEGIENPIRVARKVMDLTPHVLLVGEGARQFALDQGFETRDLLTDAARERWEAWKAEQGEPPSSTHDTIGMCALDVTGHLAVACTTSGLAWKLPGRVGDSPILGAGSFVDDEVGAAAATGVGEEVLQTCGSFLVVENLRHGMNPTEACADAVDRILRKHPQAAELQVGYVALRIDGAAGAFAIREGFRYALHDGGSQQLLDAPFRIPG